MKMKSLLITATVIFGLTSATMSQICFNPSLNFGSVNTPYSIYSNDFNNDGKKDIVVCQNSLYLITLYYGNGDGTFGSAINISTSNSPAEIIGGDFNEDGKIDLATSGGVNNVWILLADGLGGFNSPTSYSASLYPTSLTTADFNNDGHLDLAVPNGNTANTISILLGSGTGTFGSPTNFSVGTCPCGNSCVKSSDINADGNIDLLVANSNSNDVSVLLGYGSGSFGTPINYGVGNSPQSIELADFNSDTYIDIATSNQNSNNVSILLGNSGGSFSIATNYIVGNLPEQLKVADYDLDGKLDIATSDRNSNQISVLKGTGLGTFDTAITFSTASGPFALCNGDFNNDGNIDIATSNYTSTNISILLNCICSLTFTLQPNNLNINIDNNAQFTSVASDSSATYQWQTDLGVGFQNINSVGQYSGTTNDTLSVSSVTMSNNNQPFRCIIRSGSCYDTSDIAILSVCGAVTTPPANQNVVINNTAQFTTASSDLLATYQWQSDLGVGFQNINSVGQYSGTNKDTLRVANVTMGNNNQPFRCIVSSGACSDTSSAAVLTVINANGINETATNNLFTVYPNPAKSQINVKVDATLIGASYAIYDNIGKVTLTGKINAENTVIELGFLSGGMYLFSIGDNLKQIFTVVKE
jgi:hypothetical protein